jgi:membrane protein
MTLAWRSLEEWFEADVMHWGASLSYYTLLSLGPVLILLTTIAGALFDASEAQGEILSRLSILLGSRGAQVAETILREASFPGFRTWSSLLSMLVLLFAATVVFSNVQAALNDIWKFKVVGHTILNAIRTRATAFLMILVLGALIFAYLLFTTTVSVLVGVIEARLPWSSTVLRFGDAVISLVLLWLAFAAVFRVLPDVIIQWRDVVVGALATALLFTLGTELLGIFLARSDPGSMFGAAGSVFGLMVWIYYSAQVFLIGASFTKVWAEAEGREIVPETYARRVSGAAETAQAPTSGPTNP